jgi:hypothetical protein
MIRTGTHIEIVEQQRERINCRALYVPEQRCRRRGLQSRFGRWHTVYTRMSRWSRSGVLDREFQQLQRAQILRISIEAVRWTAP